MGKTSNFILEAFEPVKDLVVVENSKTSLTIRWKPVPLVNGYIITIEPLNTTQTTSFNYTLPYKRKRQEVIYEFSDLKPKSKYLVTVRTNQPASKPATLIGRTLAGLFEFFTKNKTIAVFLFYIACNVRT